MTTNLLAYNICKIFLGEAEVKGATDNSLIELAHQTTKIEGVGATAPNTDEIPWCASWVNLMVLYACFLLNADRLREYLYRRFSMAQALMNLLGVVFTNRIEMSDAAKPYHGQLIGGDSGRVITLPLGEALATKWQDWGQSVSNSDALEGDIVVLSRTGGYHVCFLAQPELHINKETFRALGGNQGDKVCYADLKTANIIAIRRCNSYKKDVSLA